ncbi:unnamed protein product [Chrysoparadoxa australica]
MLRPRTFVFPACESPQELLRASSSPPQHDTSSAFLDEPDEVVVMPKEMPFSVEQVTEILKVLRSTTRADMLIFGLDEDSVEFWHDVVQGRASFVADAYSLRRGNLRRYKELHEKYPKYDMNFRLEEAQDLPLRVTDYYKHPDDWDDLDLTNQLSQKVLTSTYQAILVDAPKRDRAWKAQIMYMASLLQEPGTSVFVENCQRTTDWRLATAMLGKDTLVRQIRRSAWGRTRASVLCHFKSPDP